jgi:hypothetical protein
MLKTSCLLVVVLSFVSQICAEPIKLHPENPH